MAMGVRTGIKTVSGVTLGTIEINVICVVHHDVLV